MQHETTKLLWDLADTASFIIADTSDVTKEGYVSDRRLRQSVERSFEIIGEVLMRLRRVDSTTADRITDARKIIGLRNRLSHGYDTDIDHAIMWDTIREYVPRLHAEVRALLLEETERH